MISYNELLRHVTQHVGSDSHACIHLDQYLRTLASDKTRFVDRVGDTGGGQYQVRFSVSGSIASRSCAERHYLGPTAARVVTVG